MDKYLAKELNQNAKRVLSNPHYTGCNQNDLDNCEACALSPGKVERPNYVGWARVYVEAERPIPEMFRSAFYDELVSDNLSYRKALEESVRWFGVRWKKV